MDIGYAVIRSYGKLPLKEVCKLIIRGRRYYEEKRQKNYPLVKYGADQFSVSIPVIVDGTDFPEDEGRCNDKSIRIAWGVDVQQLCGCIYNI